MDKIDQSDQNFLVEIGLLFVDELSLRFICIDIAKQTYCLNTQHFYCRKLLKTIVALRVKAFWFVDMKLVSVLLYLACQRYPIVLDLIKCFMS